jgi:hypothetical protein
MIHYTHDLLIRRNTVLGRVLSFGGLGILVLALVASLIRPTSIGVILPFSLIGMAISQAGSIYMTRWNKRGRADLMLDEALKGLDGRYTLCHFLLGTQHVLFGPPGILALVPRNDVGLVEHEDGKWWITGFRKGQLHGKRREMAGLSDEAQGAVVRLERKLARLSPQHAEWTVTPILVFLGEGTRVEAEGSSPPAVHVKKLKELVRRMPRRPAPSEDDLGAIAASFPRQPSAKTK